MTSKFATVHDKVESVYYGPATLTLHGQTREYTVTAHILELRDIEISIDGVTLAGARAWRADVVAIDQPKPPNGDCVLRLPDGSAGVAPFGGLEGTLAVWEATLYGIGPSPASTQGKLDDQH